MMGCRDAFGNSDGGYVTFPFKRAVGDGALDIGDGVVDALKWASKFWGGLFSLRIGTGTATVDGNSGIWAVSIWVSEIGGLGTD